jgi:esterase/lipase
MKLVFKLIFIFCCINSFSQQNLVDLRISGFKLNTIVTKNDTINFLSSNLKSDIPKPTILFIQGSKAIPIFFKDVKKSFVNIPFNYKNYLDNFNFVIISRKGIPILGDFPKDASGYLDSLGKTPFNYIKYDNLNYRTLQAKTVLNYLYKQKWVQRNSIYVIGHSEGYRVAAKLASKTNKISKLICMSADPFNRTAEMIFRERINCFINENDSIPQSKIDLLIRDYKDIKSNIKRYRNDYGLYNWISYEKDISYKNFKNFKNPILIVYGTNDIPATHNDLIPFLLKQDNISIKSFSDYDHNYFKKEYNQKGDSIEPSFHWDDVFSFCVKWLLSK